MKAVLIQAVDWYVKLNDSSANPATQAGWQAWLAADPLHAQAWARVEQLQSQLGRVPAGMGRTLESAREQRRRAVKLLALLLGAGAVSWQGYRHSPLSADYATRVGERRQVTLADGTRLDLNTDTQVDVHFDSEHRAISLRRGEICLETGKDPRPLRVWTSDGSVEALGTRFSVRLDEHQTRVNVEAHAVQVRPRLLSETIRVEAGQSLLFSADHLGQPQDSPPTASAWTRGMLVAVNWRLDDFLGELGRYRPGYLGCAPDVAGLRLSGAFTLDDTEAVLSNLTLSLPVRLRQFSRYWVKVEAA
ncbi:FecR domain-containing protein [Pseudomonas sp. 5P_5.1_Bac1]|uniref:FecR domain-containing protein n=1 Tax=Pseudomonas sp. 5P_5.1_Bac1 TaxID=2971616 RepID=UPI0021C89395|nr:FecR domain-containing protein [Pseudomonas sp. 5P_5.1_Bac1]MCU1721571.1 FecR domain-containing protein [Pseudomonas sp. 5P_5.1_Bac1]